MPDDEPEERQLTLVANASMSHGSGDITPGNAVDQIVCSCQQYRNGATGHETYLCMGPREGWGTPCYPLAPVCNPDMTLCWNSGNTPHPTSENAQPTRRPTRFPTLFPTRLPSPWPTLKPSPVPTSYPTQTPTGYPTLAPVPTLVPTTFPTDGPTYPPSPHFALVHRQADCGGYDKYFGRIAIGECAEACAGMSGLFTYGRPGTDACLPMSSDLCVCRCELATPVGASDCYPYYGNQNFDLYQAIAATGAPSFLPSELPTQHPSGAPTVRPSTTSFPTWVPSAPPTVPPSSSSCICPARAPTPVCAPTLSPCCMAWIGLGGLLALAAVIFGLRRNPCRRRPALHVAEEHIAVPIVELTRTSETRANLPPHDSMRAANSMQGR